jgi:hypothetical protein
VCVEYRLYNKEAVLLALLDKPSIPEVARHVRSLKDVTVLQLSVNSSYKPSSKADTYNDTQTSQYVCPVTGLEMSGIYRFVFLRGCGCVISEKALKEVPSETCHKCGAGFKSEHVVRLNVSEEEEKGAREEMEEKRRQAKMAKRKRKAVGDPEPSSTTTSSEASGSGSATRSGSDKESPPPEKKTKSSSSSVTTAAGVTQPTGKRATKKLCSNGGGQMTNGAVASRPGTSKLSKPSVGLSETEERDKVLEMAEGRKVYKSLFSSNTAARPKEKTSNWVTYFPYH